MQQSYLIAKKVFEQAESSTIKFVLIGLSPYVVPANDNEPPIANPLEEKVLEDYFKLCVDNGARPVCIVLPIKRSLRRSYNADVVKLFRDTINRIGKNYKTTFVDLLDDPCLDLRFISRARFNPEGAGPAFVSALIGSRLYLAKIISAENISAMSAEYFNVLKQYYPDDYKIFSQNLFCEMACKHFKLLAKILPQDVCKDTMAKAFSEMTYNHLAILSNMLPKDEYNDLAARIFEITAEKIRRKDKIKVGFFFEHPSKWCGDNLYNFFADDKRFEPTVFHYPVGNELAHKEFDISLEKFKAHGINVFVIEKSNSEIPAQDVLFLISPYDNGPLGFRLRSCFHREKVIKREHEKRLFRASELPD